MSRRVLISGSVAYDTIMVFEGHFKDHILPDRVHMLNVAFLAPTLKREYGGCAANIAYNLVGLGGHPVVLATIGRDGDDYLARLDALGIDVSRILRLDGALHGAGVHHHRSGRQPDHRLPPRRHVRCACGVGGSGAARRRRRQRSASSRRTAATRCCSTRANSSRPAFPTSSTRARVCRCSTVKRCADSSRPPQRSPSTTTRRRCWSNAPAGASRRSPNGSRR